MRRRGWLHQGVRGDPGAQPVTQYSRFLCVSDVLWEVCRCVSIFRYSFRMQFMIARIRIEYEDRFMNRVLKILQALLLVVLFQGIIPMHVRQCICFLLRFMKRPLDLLICVDITRSFRLPMN